MFVTVANGVIAADVLRSGIVRRLHDADPRARVVVFTPMLRDPAFVEEFKAPWIEFEDLPPHTPRGLEARLLAMIQAGYLTSRITDSVEIRRAEALANGTVRWLRFKRALAHAAAPSMLRPATRYDVIDRVVRHPEVEALFDKYRPSLVVAGHVGLVMSEVPMLRTARRRGIRSAVIYASWDNFTNKLLPARPVDRLVVWNEIMKRQAIDLHGYEARNITITGAPQFDLYFRPGTLSSREAFLRRIGADPARKLVTLTTSARQLYAHFERVIRILAGANASGRWGVPAQILVRVHPRDELSRYDAFRGIPHVIIEKPFRDTIRAGDGMAVDMLPEQKRHLADTMAFSDVVIGVASTILIEASIFDTPIVNVAFDGDAPSPFAQSARRYYRFTHIATVMRHNPGPVSETPEQLLEHVHDAIRNPSRYAEGRRRVVLEQCQFLDGRATERVGDCLVDELADVCGAHPIAAGAAQ